MKFHTGVLDFSGPTLVMAIVNCTDDSFYAPSRTLKDMALERALTAEEEGAAIVDFGGESSRPGSLYVSEETEMERVIPVIKAFRKKSSLPVSVDTRKASVARSALDAGADIINDISGLGDDPLMAGLCAERGAAVVLMHKKGVPLTMQDSPDYEDLAMELKAWFALAAERALLAGISPEKIILDPGIGFGKTLNGNLEILRRLAEICAKDYPVLVGLSRKSFIGEITGRPAEDRLPGTLAANGAAIMGGAHIIRVHDVKENVDLAKILFAIRAGTEH
jgi:dihydropteroate synthase